MHDDRTVTITLDSTELAHFRGIVREEVVLWCTHIHDNDESGTLGEDDELADRLETLAIFTRLDAQLERKQGIAIAPSDLPSLRAVLRDLVFVEQDGLADIEMARQRGEGGDLALAAVEGECRVALILDSIAPQIGGLF